MYAIDNMAEFTRGWQKWLKEAEKTALTAYRGLAAYAFKYIVGETPQYTGEAVANWRMNVGSPLYSRASGIKAERRKGETVYSKQGFAENSAGAGQGNPKALRYTKDSMRAALARVTLEQDIFITNATAFKGRGVGDLETGGSWLRAVNQPGQMIGRATSYINENFKTVDASTLRRLMAIQS